MSNSARPSESAESIQVSAEAPPTILRDGRAQVLRRNLEVDWEEFDSHDYWKHNYETLRNDDQSIIQAVAGFFSRHFRNAPRGDLLRGLDVGSGANLYPALGLLPWSGKITLTDPSSANIAWLRRAAAGIGVENEQGEWVWQPFWAEFARFSGYQQLANPRQLLAARHEVRRARVDELDEAGWDIGTMFFVAESTTSYQEEFRTATAAFLRALVPGAPFAAAFMDGSVGYSIGGRSFPAVRSVNADLIGTVLSAGSDDVTVLAVDVPAQNPLQDGYEGMVVAFGTTAFIHPAARSGSGGNLSIESVTRSEKRAE
jgi:hypothetical protein